MQCCCVGSCRAESEGRGEEAARLAAAHSSLRVQLGEAEGRLAHTQQALEERQGQCDQLEARYVAYVHT